MSVKQLPSVNATPEGNRVNDIDTLHQDGFVQSYNVKFESVDQKNTQRERESSQHFFHWV